MNCALWLNRRKVLNADEIAKNLDIASLRGYFLAGSLTEWLNEHGGENYAEKLEQLSADDERLNEKLGEIFSGTPLPAKTFGISEDNEAPANKNFACPSSTPFNGSYELAASFVSEASSYTQFTSFGEFEKIFRNLQSGSFGSFEFGSFHKWEWEWIFRFVSQNYGSFGYGSFGSFSEWEWEWLFRLFSQGYGSFGYGSFGSFNEWEWEWLFRLFSQSYGSFGSGSFGSFGNLSMEFLNGLFGSFSAFAKLSNLPVLDEYDRIMLETLMRCPLDRFGYGIHNI